VWARALKLAADAHVVRPTEYDHSDGVGGRLDSSWRFAMASIASSINVTRGSGTSACGSVLGVNSGRGSGFVVLGIWQRNPVGPRKVPNACLYGHREHRGLTRKCS